MARASDADVASPVSARDSVLYAVAPAEAGIPWKRARPPRQESLSSKRFGPVLAGLALMVGATPLLAAEAPAQAWPTEISGTGSTVGATRVFGWRSSPFGDPDVSAVQTITSIVAAPSAAGCLYLGGAGAAGGTNGLSGVRDFIEPDFPASNALLANNCLEGGRGYVSSFQFDKPVIAPIFHVYNLDASRMALTGTSTTGAPIGLTTIVKNDLMDISGTTLNNTVQPATTAGCNTNSASDTSNGACGSFRVIASSGLIQSLTLNNNTTPPISTPGGSNDGFSWTVSFPTAPLTKAFSPTTIVAGGTSQLTFSIENPNESASVTLTPLDFRDDLPAGLALATASATNNGSCGSPAVTNGTGGALAPGATSIRASGISVAPGATCTITVDVTAAAAGSYTNGASNMSSSVGNLVPSGSATLMVEEPTADLAITKDDGADTYVPGFEVVYTIVVSNNGPSDVAGAAISDPLPAGIVNASWTCGDETNGAVCGVASGTGAIDTTADLPSGGSVAHVLSMTVPVDYTGSLVNTATVTPPDGITESDLSNNAASDTNTMEDPPVSGACSPLTVAQGASFTLAPFPTTGTIQKSAARGWQTANPWATQGGNYTFTWTFSQPVPVSWIRFAVIDVNETSGIDYDANPPVFTIGLAGGTATAADFSLAAGDLVYSGGSLRFRPGGPYRQSGYLQGNGANTVRSITITSSGVATGDNIANGLYVRPACMTLQKVSDGSTDSFGFDMTNVVLADGTAVPATTLTTTSPDTPVSSPVYYSIIGTDVTLSEVVPAGWELESASCTDRNAGNTGNPPAIGNFASPTVTIPSANVRPQADIQCLFTNAALPVADLGIVKTVSPEDAITGDEVVYALELVNNGPEAADGAIVTDPGVPDSLECTALSCSATGGAGCPAAPTPQQLATGLVVPTFPAGGRVTLELTCTVTATGL